MLNRLGVYHECDKRMNGRREGQIAVSNNSLAQLDVG